jgi:hypothetical protein
VLGGGAAGLATAVATIRAGQGVVQVERHTENPRSATPPGSSRAGGGQASPSFANRTRPRSWPPVPAPSLHGSSPQHQGETPSPTP